MITVVLYRGQEMHVEKPDGIKNLKRCYNPICQKLVQFRPEDPSAWGRPREFCTEACRHVWKRRRTKEKKLRAQMRRRERMH